MFLLEVTNLFTCQDEGSETGNSKFANSRIDESKKLSPIKSKKKSFELLDAVKSSGKVEWNLRVWVSSVLWVTNFFGQLGQDNLEGLFEASDDEEILKNKKKCASLSKHHYV